MFVPQTPKCLCPSESWLVALQTQSSLSWNLTAGQQAPVQGGCCSRGTRILPLTIGLAPNRKTSKMSDCAEASIYFSVRNFSGRIRNYILVGLLEMRNIHVCFTFRPLDEHWVITRVWNYKGNSKHLQYH